MKKVAVVTSTRVEYGLLSPFIKKLRTFENDDFRLLCENSKSLYGDGHSSEKIANKIFDTIMSRSIN